MKNRTALALVEQVIMLLVLAVAAALCLQAFAWADSQSAHYVRQDEAMRQAQTAAEVLKSTRGDLDAAAEILDGYLEEGALVVPPEENGLCLTANLRDSGSAHLGMALIQVWYDEEVLTELTVCWQEVAQ